MRKQVCDELLSGCVFLVVRASAVAVEEALHIMMRYVDSGLVDYLNIVWEPVVSMKCL